ncbi:MAG: hypothetical protein LUH17_06590 [Acidaminococcaceae bacterium]|nr:hypothetical protein [Acidaminococcaceae bacterium]
MLIEVLLVLLLVSITCCSLLAGYQAYVITMQQHNRLEVALELAEASDTEKADTLAAEQGLVIDRKEISGSLQIRQQIISVMEYKSKKVLVNKVRYAMP